jgi:hypothetical protein
MKLHDQKKLSIVLRKISFLKKCFIIRVPELENRIIGSLFVQEKNIFQSKDCFK